MKRHSYKQVGEEAGKYLYLLYRGIQEQLQKDALSLNLLKQSYNKSLNHVMSLLITLELFRTIQVLSEVFTESFALRQSSDKQAVILHTLSIQLTILTRSFEIFKQQRKSKFITKANFLLCCLCEDQEVSTPGFLPSLRKRINYQPSFENEEKRKVRLGL